MLDGSLLPWRKMRRPLAVIVLAALTASAARAHAQAPEPPPEEAFGPRYVIESVEVRGNAKTRASVIIDALTLKAGDAVTPDDVRVEASRFRVFGTGFFEDVRLSLRRGSVRGRVVLVVDVVERGTIIINELFLGTSEATALWA